MPVQAAHKLEPPLAYAASKARQPPKTPPPQTLREMWDLSPQYHAAKRAGRGSRAKRAQISKGDPLHHLHTAATQTAIACLRSYIHAKPPAPHSRPPESQQAQSQQPELKWEVYFGSLSATTHPCKSRPLASPTFRSSLDLSPGRGYYLSLPNRSPP